MSRRKANNSLYQVDLTFAGIRNRGILILKEKHFLLFLFFIFSFLSKSQNLLSLEDAIKTALEKNLSVYIYKNQFDISRMQNSFGNAGMSPTVSVNANLGFASTNSHFEFNTGAVQDRAGAKSNNLGASLNVAWTVFDGFKMFAVKKRLEQNQRLSIITLKQQLEETVYSVILEYYNVVRINELIKASKQNLLVFEERKKIAKLKMEIGSDSKMDFLLSQTNENKAKSDILQLELQLLTAKTSLNALLNLPLDNEVTTVDSIRINYEPGLGDLRKDALKNNFSVLSTKQSESILESGVKEANAANYPFIQINGAYNFARNSSEAGIIFLNRQNGINGGVSLNWMLFNGGKNRRLVMEKNILLSNQKLFTEQTIQKVDALVYIHYNAFLVNKKILELEKQNMEGSKEVFSVSLERYKVGKTNLLETIEMQKNLEEAQLRYVNALYAMKVSETQLLRAKGELVK